MRLIPNFIAAAFASPEVPVADLESLTRVEGGCGLQAHAAVSRFGGYVGSVHGGYEQCDLYKNNAGEWDLVLSKRSGFQQAPITETVGTFSTLDDAVPYLRVASDLLRKKYSGVKAAFSGMSYSESDRADGIAAVERALALKKEASAAPQPRP